MFTALNLKEPTEETGGRIGKHTEIHILDGENAPESHNLKVNGLWNVGRAPIGCTSSTKDV